MIAPLADLDVGCVDMALCELVTSMFEYGTGPNRVLYQNELLAKASQIHCLEILGTLLFVL